jgi:hypothetical protein
MRVIPINEIPEELHTIPLHNGKEAVLHQTIITRVPEVNPDEDIMVHKYKVPCPVCGFESIAFSYDGKFFSNIQLNCRYCGVFFRPVVKR